VRIESGHHAVDGALDEIVGAYVLDVVALDDVDDVREDFEALVRVTRRSGNVAHPRAEDEHADERSGENGEPELS